MNTQKMVSLLCAAMISTISASARPCSSAAIECEGGGLVYAHNYDYFMDAGRIEINQRGVSKQAVTMGSGSTPVEWTSKYGSISFNMYGREMPQSGMNEQGLLISQAWVNECVYPDPDDTPVLNELQFMQYVLDSFATVDEAVVGIEQIAIEAIYGLEHYMICDATDECAQIEYLNGERLIHRGDTLPLKVLTNNTYSDSLDFLEDNPADIEGDGSLERFARASAFTESETDCSDPPALGFELLDDVAQAESTVWQLVFLPKQKQIFLKTNQVESIREIDLDNIDFDCTMSRRSLDIHEPIEGAIEDAFVEYTAEDNLALVTESLNAIMPEATAEAVINIIAAFPENLVCTSASPDETDDDTDTDTEEGDVDTEDNLTGDDAGADDSNGDNAKDESKKKSSGTCSYVPGLHGDGLQLLPALLGISF